MTESAAKKLDAHIWQREDGEHYVEPHWCSQRLFEVEDFHPHGRQGSIWDPCCGFGRIVESAAAAGYATVATDKADRGYKMQGKVCDFLTTNILGHNIVCNPPFDVAPAFAAHALNLCQTKVAMIFPTARLNAARWLRGTPLARIWLMTPRPSMPPGHVIARGAKPGGGKMDFCWLVWTKGRIGPADLRWLTRDPE